MATSDENPTQERVEATSRAATNNPQAQHVPLWQSVKKWPRVIAYCLALSSAIVLYGYDLVIVGTVSAMPVFQHKFGEQFGKRFIIPTMWLSLWNVAGPIGMMIGSIIGGPFQDRGGRRISLAAGAFLSAIAVAVCYVADLPDDITTRRGVFFVGKLFQGVCLGILLCVVQTYMSEVLPVLLRGPIIAFVPIFTLLGQLIGSVVVYNSLKLPSSDSYRIPFASQWPFSAVTFLLAAILPESPTWLMRRGRADKALKAQKRLERPCVDSEAIIEGLRISILAEEETRGISTYTDCFRGMNLRRTLIVALANCLPQLFGLSLLANASYFAQIVGMSSSNSLIFLILGICLGLIANVGSLWVLNEFGRRFLVLLTLGISLVLWLAMGIAGCFQGVVMIWYTSVTMIIVTMVCGLGIWPASHVIAAETSSLQLRAKTQGIGWFVSGVAQGVFSISLPYMYNLDAGNLKAKTGLVMAGCTAVGVAATWIWVPEMKGRSPMEIDRMFALRLKTRAFKNWKSDVVIEKNIDALTQTAGI